MKSQCDNNKNFITSPEALSLITKENLDFRSVSAKDNNGINELFMTVGKKFINQSTSTK